MESSLVNVPSVMCCREGSEARVELIDEGKCRRWEDHCVEKAQRLLGDGRELSVRGAMLRPLRWSKL